MFVDKAKRLAEILGCNYQASLSAEKVVAGGYVLSYTEQGLELFPRDRKSGGPVRVSFVEGKTNHRRMYGGGSGQMIAKAVGIKPGIKPHVLDATAGLGQDSFVLATLGCTVEAVERSPVVYRLLDDGLIRAKSSSDAEVAAIVSRIHLSEGDAVSLLSASQENIADVIYLDPMFPSREKSSKVKKEMRYFKDIVGGDLDAEKLLEHALEKARYRVVVKRPRLAPAIIGPEKTYSIEGKSSRYDIYTFKSMDELKGAG